MSQLLGSIGVFGGAQERWALVNMEGLEDAITFTSFIDADIKDEGKVVSAQVEEGSYATYNKTDSPLAITVTLGLQGTDGELQDAIQTLEGLREGMDLLGLDIPVITYGDLALEAFDYQLKRENGRGCLFCTLHLVSVLQVEAEYTDAKVAPEQNRGKVQPKQQGQGQGQQKAGNKSVAKMIFGG